MCVVIIGTVAQGWSIYGPFDDHDTALAWAENIKAFAWEIVELCNPEGIDEDEHRST